MSLLIYNGPRGPLAKNLSGSIAASGTITKASKQSKGGVTSLASALVKLGLRTRTGAIASVSASIIRQQQKALTGNQVIDFHNLFSPPDTPSSPTWLFKMPLKVLGWLQSLGSGFTTAAGHFKVQIFGGTVATSGQYTGVFKHQVNEMIEVTDYVNFFRSGTNAK